VITKPLQKDKKDEKVIVKKEYVPYYYRYSHYPNYWDEPHIQRWPVSYDYPFYYGAYGVGGYSGGYSGGIRTGSGASGHHGVSGANGHHGGGHGGSGGSGHR
jgi:hypothetical protein